MSCPIYVQDVRYIAVLWIAKNVYFHLVNTDSENKKAGNNYFINTFLRLISIVTSSLRLTGKAVDNNFPQALLLKGRELNLLRVNSRVNYGK